MDFYKHPDSLVVSQFFPSTSAAPTSPTSPLARDKAGGDSGTERERKAGREERAVAAGGNRGAMVFGRFTVRP